MTTIDQAVYEWLLQCESLQQLMFQFGKASDSVAFLLYDNETVLQLYTDGTADRRVTYQVVPFADFSTEAADNIDAMAAVRSIIDWIHECEKRFLYPSIGGVFRVEAGDIRIATVNTPNRLAKYQFPLHIYYEE